MQAWFAVAILLTGFAQSDARFLQSRSHQCPTKHFVYLPQMADKCNFLPDEWASINGNCEDIRENSQSPIRLDVRQCLASPELRSLHFSNEFYYEADFTAQHVGYSVSFTPQKKHTVSGGYLIGTYRVFSLHLHWGSGKSDDVLGSEHRFVNSYGFEHPTTMELHIELLKEGDSETDAQNMKGHTAIIGVLYQSSEWDRDDASLNDEQPSMTKAFAQLGSCVENLKNPCHHSKECATEIVTFRLIDLLPHDVPLKYINYDGSFTTPSCNPVVKWHVIYPPVSINQQSIAQFSQMNYNKHNPMLNNHRPLQQLHGREIRCYP